MKTAIPILFVFTAGFEVTELAASTIYQWTAMAADSSTYAQDRAYEWTSTSTVPTLNAPFTLEAWAQFIDDFQANRRIFDNAEPDAADKDSFETRGVMRDVADDRYARAPAHAESHYLVEAPFEISTLLGLALILVGLIPRGWRNPLKFCGVAAGLSCARVLRAGGVKLRRRSEAELNSFSACYATTRVQEEAPLAGCAVAVAFQRPRSVPGPG